MLKLLAICLLLLASTPAFSLGVPPSLRADLEKTGEWPALAERLAEARAQGVADRELSARLWLPGYNLAGRHPARVVVILVDFPDKAADHTTFTRAWYSKLLFSVGETGTGSFRDYFREISYGADDITGVVAGWYMMPQPLAFYTGGEYGLGAYPLNAQRLAEDAMRAADEDVNFSLFDNDGPDGLPDSGDDDGFVDAVLVVHAGPAAEKTASKGDIWSHQFAVHESVSLDGVLGGLYWTVAEDARIGVVCHEFGHILGLLDLYDLDVSSAGLGWWSLMAYGAWADAGLTPPHPDAWSLVQLGFVTPVVPDRNLESVSIPPVENAPVVYKLWMNGTASNEYFLVENRRRTGFDASIPAEGLLVYHVDEQQPSNLDESHYRVALEQADGFRHLEQGFWHGNLGDAGDPYPGIMRADEFSVATSPGSRSYTGLRTSVAVRRIHESGENIVADIETFAAPSVGPLSLLIDDADDDGCFSPGETGRIAVRVRNAGEAGGPWDAEFISGDPALSIANAAATVPSMAGGPLEAQSTWVAVHALEGASGNASVTVRLTTAGQTLAERTFTISLDAAPRRSDDLDDRSGWTVDPSGSSALWERGEGIWKLRPGYGPYADAVLTSPLFAVPPRSVLRFAYRCGLPGPEDAASDGVEVEGSLDGSAWTALAPLAAAELPVLANPARALAGRSVLSDTTVGWTNAVYALGAGGAWSVRFRFGSDAIMNGGFFEIDSLSAGTGLTAAAPRVSCVRAAGTVRIEVSLDEPERFAGVAFLRRDGAAGAFRKLHGGWISPGDGRIVRIDTAPRGEVFYRVDLLSRDGGLESIGPFAPAEAAAQAALEFVSPNPFRAEARLAFRVPEGARGFSLRVFDVAGREVEEIASGSRARGGEAVWDGLDSCGSRAGAGLYFFRLEWPGGSRTLRAVRLP